MITQWFYESSVQRFHGLSTDTKPTDCTNGSVFVELDTAKIYLFNEAALTWHVIPDDSTGDYNDLSNKPSINGVTLSGDKSLADIGLVNPLIIKGRVDSESDLPSNAQTGWVYFVGLTTDEDLDEYVYTADGEWELLGISHIVVDSAISTTSENPVQNKVITKALNDKVDPLIALEVADRAALADIINSNGKNLCETRNANNTLPTRWVDVPVNLESGAYTVSFGNLGSTDTDSTTCQAVFLDASNQQISQWLMFSRGQNVSKDADITGTAVKFRLYPSNSYANSEGDTVTVTDIMICKRSYYAISSEFVPYTPTSTSILTPISESAYEALTVKDKPLYFIYEDV